MSVFNGDHLLCIRGERVVFSDLKFEITDGQCLTLIGHNGAGKSSLLRMMGGLLHPRAGTLSWDDQDITKEMDEHRAQLHYVGHHDAVKPVLSVEENLHFWAHIRGDKDKKPQNYFKAALDVFDIAHLLHVPGRFLSAGQKRRVNLARILTSPAKLWLLDEPTTALDRQSIRNLEEAIENHRKSGGMVVLSTHSEMALSDQNIFDVSGFKTQTNADAFSLLAQGI